MTIQPLTLTCLTLQLTLILKIITLVWSSPKPTCKDAKIIEITLLLISVICFFYNLHIGSNISIIFTHPILSFITFSFLTLSLQHTENTKQKITLSYIKTLMIIDFSIVFCFVGFLAFDVISSKP
ncbi:hypothetical protein CU052_00225 (plasmid) [Vibrio harveyi]|nr:hypothetical protein CU052_00225 [Vibrio harveyi]